MKKIALSFLLVAMASTSFCKNKNSKHNTPTQFAFDISGTFGTVKHDFNTDGKIGNFLTPVIYNPGTLKFTGGSSQGFDAQFSFFFGQRRTFGMGFEFWYCLQKGDLSLDGFHVEYKATDKYGQSFRQLLTANSLKESHNIRDVNLPIVAKYRLPIGNKLVVNIDGGIVINVHEATKYDSKASFDFEAIYKLSNPGNDKFDDAVTPDPNDYQITRSYLQKTGFGAITEQYFAEAQAQGDPVGLNVLPNSNQNSQHGSFSYSVGSIGFLLRPSIAYNLSKEWSVVVGGYLMSLNVKNKPASDYRIMDLEGNYSSPAEAVTTLKVTSYGLNLGLRYSFIHKINRRLNR